MPEQRAALAQANPPAAPGLLERFFTRYRKLSLDADTIHEVRLLFQNTRRSGGHFLHSRAAAGELRLLHRIHSSPAVAEIRCVRAESIAGERFTDMQFRFSGESSWYDLEVRTFTGARQGVTGRPRGQPLLPGGSPHAAEEAALARTGYSSSRVAAGFREKIRHGQVTNGVVALNVAVPPPNGALLLTESQRFSLAQDLANPIINRGQRVRELWLVVANERVELVAALPDSTLLRRVLGSPSSAVRVRVELEDDLDLDFIQDSIDARPHPARIEVPSTRRR